MTNLPDNLHYGSIYQMRNRIVCGLGTRLQWVGVDGDVTIGTIYSFDTTYTYMMNPINTAIRVQNFNEALWKLLP